MAPLSSLATVIKTRDASSINVPLATANLVSGSVWIVYGLALRDVYLWGPCTIGAPLGLLQILIKAFLRKRDPALPLHRRLPTEDYHSAHTPEVALVHEDFHHDATLPKASGGRLGDNDTAGQPYGRLSGRFHVVRLTAP